MPSNVTPNYQLNQWEPGDQVQRVDFNADNAKIDAAIKAVDTKAAAKAEQSALTAEAQVRQSADSALDSKVNTINATLPKKGNCEIYYTTYSGNGASSRTLSFPKKPLMVFIMGSNVILRAIAGAPTAISSTASSYGSTANTSWSGNSFTWTLNSAAAYKEFNCNNSGETYYVIALLNAAT